MKRALALILALCLCLSMLAACSSNTGNNSSNTGSNSNNSSTPSNSPEGNNSSNSGGDTGNTTPDEVYTLKWGTVSTEITPVGQAMKIVAEEIEKRTNGGIKFELYFASTLGSANEMADGLLMGAVDIANLNAGVISTYGVEKAEVFNLPFIFQSDDHVKAVADTYGDEIVANAEDVIGVPLGFWSMGWRDIMNSKRDINSMEDFKGLMLRVQSGTIFVDSFKALGCSPQTMAIGEVYTSIQQGILDGHEAPINQYYGEFHDEIMSHLTLTQHICGITVPVLSNVTAAKLPAEYLTILEEVFDEYEWTSMDIHATEDADAVQAMVERSGISVTEPDEEMKAAMREAVAPVIEAFVPTIGEDMYNGILALANG